MGWPMTTFWTDARFEQALALFPHTDGRNCPCACDFARVALPAERRFWTGRTTAPTLLERLALRGWVSELYERTPTWQALASRWLKDEERRAVKEGA